MSARLRQVRWIFPLLCAPSVTERQPRPGASEHPAQFSRAHRLPLVPLPAFSCQIWRRQGQGRGLRHRQQCGQIEGRGRSPFPAQRTLDREPPGGAGSFLAVSRMRGVRCLRVTASHLSRHRSLDLKGSLFLQSSRGPALPSRLARGSFPMAQVAAGSASAAQSPKPAKEVAKRLEPFGTTIFTEMSALAAQHGAVNLGQGFPNFDGPKFIMEAAAKAMLGPQDTKNQYAPMAGVPELTSAIAKRFELDTGLKVDPKAEVTVTSGCTEAIAATVLGLVDPGDEVVVFEPFYDSYIATLSMAGAVVRPVTLRPPHFDFSEAQLREAFTPLTSGAKTRMVFVNTPHNPTGKVFTYDELDFVASLCKERDTIAVSDEVYYKMVYPGTSDANGTANGDANGAKEVKHISIATLPGMYERTITLNSLGKTYSLTGWKVGWAIAPPNLTWGLRQAHSFFTFSVPTPLQYGAAAALNAPEEFYSELQKEYQQRKDVLIPGLKEVGFTVYEPEGSYFVMVDHTSFGYGSDMDFCLHLIKEVGVAAIPPSSFYLTPGEGRNLVRFAFCKDEATLAEAVKRLKEKLRPKQA